MYDDDEIDPNNEIEIGYDYELPWFVPVVKSDKRSKVYIYVLKDPETQEPRYVGFTRNPRRRYIQHLIPSEVDSEKNRWIVSLYCCNRRPVFQVIDIYEGSAEPELLEDWWICEHSIYFNLVQKCEKDKDKNREIQKLIVAKLGFNPTETYPYLYFKNRHGRIRFDGS